MPKYSQSLMVEDRFFEQAREMRGFFENQFKDPRVLHPKRFVWDYWHVPGQYTLLRTPAYEYFPKAIYQKLHQQLVFWGRENLGCHDISPPWLSCYVDGCGQELHGDLPHGPWAFVYSLSPPGERRFTGGETVLIQEPILSYWDQFKTGQSLEMPEIVETVPSLFNRLVVFDPRIPHGVSQIKGTQNPLYGRLVVHGWFVQPRPFIRGKLGKSELQKLIRHMGERLAPLFAEGYQLYGVTSARFEVSAQGQIKNLKVLTNTLRSSQKEVPQAVMREIKSILLNHRFNQQKGVSKVTLPIIFENQSW